MKLLKILNTNKFAIVDDEDYERCRLYKWGLAHSCIRKTTEPRIRLSNYVMQDRDNVYDHKDRNFFNNQKENLRIVTHQQNSYNREKPFKFKQSTSNYKGVHWHKGAKLWAAQIRVNKRCISLGYFDNEKEAALTYNKAAIKFHGEFACLNKIEN